MSNYNNRMKEMLYLISKISEKGNHYITDELKKNGATGLVPSHGDILMALYVNGKMLMKDIAAKIHRTKPTVTVLVDKLEKLGYVKREACAEDSRRVYIVLTKKGEEFKTIFERISEGLNEMLYKSLTDEEASEIERLLKKVLE